MNVKQIISSILLLAFTSTVTAQKVTTRVSWLTDIPDAQNSIAYNPQQKLTIADFKGKPDAGADAVALTSSGFAFQAGYNYEGDKAALSVAVYCSFYKNESWMKERGKNAYVLAHEQRHFDISYWGTLEFIKKIKQTTFRQQYSEQLKTIYSDVVKQMSELQQQYDTETNNGINTTKQEEWNKKIAKKLSDAAKEAVL
jgi:hypothetical protein